MPCFQPMLICSTQRSIALQKQMREARLHGCHNFMSVYPGGGIGNVMCQYVSLLGISGRLGFKPVITEEMRRKLRRFFPYLSTVSTGQSR